MNEPIPARRDLPRLGTGSSDILANVLRGSLGAVPVVGAALAELVGVVIPNQRIERAEGFLLLLAAELSSLIERSRLSESLLTTETAADLVEEGIAQAIRARSEERLAYIARLVAKGLEQTEVDILLSIRLVRLMAEIDDGELLLLRALDENNRDMLNKLEGRDLGFEPGEEEMTESTLLRAGRAKLIRLLLVDEFHRHKNGVPQYDRLKRPEMDYCIAPLGQVLVRALGWRRW